MKKFQKYIEDKLQTLGEQSFQLDILDAAILAHLEQNPGASIRDIGDAVDVKPGFGRDPMKSPLNQALVKLRDGGMIDVHNPQWGEPTFTLK